MRGTAQGITAYRSLADGSIFDGLGHVLRWGECVLFLDTDRVVELGPSG